MIKNKLLLLAVITTSFLLPSAVRAIGLTIELGDRPYYTHGARYQSGDYQMIWAPGHMSRSHHWIHGKYVRGQQRRHESNMHHNNQQDDHGDDNRR